MLAFTLTLLAAAAAEQPKRLPPDASRGAELYRVHCWQCHGATGAGDGPRRLAASHAPAGAGGRGAPGPLDGGDRHRARGSRRYASLLGGPHAPRRPAGLRLVARHRRRGSARAAGGCRSRRARGRGVGGAVSETAVRSGAGPGRLAPRGETMHRTVTAGLALLALYPLPALGADVENGRTVYLANCMACHGVDADGKGPAAAAISPPTGRLHRPGILGRTDRRAGTLHRALGQAGHVDDALLPLERRRPRRRHRLPPHPSASAVDHRASASPDLSRIGTMSPSRGGGVGPASTSR